MLNFPKNRRSHSKVFEITRPFSVNCKMLRCDRIRFFMEHYIAIWSKSKWHAAVCVFSGEGNSTNEHVPSWHERQFTRGSGTQYSRSLRRGRHDPEVTAEEGPSLCSDRGVGANQRTLWRWWPGNCSVVLWKTKTMSSAYCDFGLFECFLLDWNKGINQTNQTEKWTIHS